MRASNSSPYRSGYNNYSDKPSVPVKTVPTNTFLKRNIAPADLETLPINDPDVLLYYQPASVLGKGSFGTTYLAYDRNGDKVAIKVVKYNKPDEQSIIDEIETLKLLSRKGCSPNIVCYRDFILKDINGESYAFIVTEYIEGGTLTDYVKIYGEQSDGDSDVKILKRERLLPLVFQLLRGCHEIHDAGLAHRDIKLDNIMVSNTGEVKYIDFGLSCIQECRWKDCTNICASDAKPGSIGYQPPEDFIYPPIVNTLFSAQAHDIWSLGIVIWKLTNLEKFPFEVSSSMITLRSNILNAPAYRSYYEDDFKNEAIDIWIDTLLYNDYKRRPSISVVYLTFVENILTNINI